MDLTNNGVFGVRDLHLSGKYMERQGEFIIFGRYTVLGKTSLLLGMLAFVMSSLFMGTAGAATVSLEPSLSIAKADETFNLNIYITDVSDLYGASVDFTFDPSLVKVASGQDNPVSGENAVLAGPIFANPESTINTFDNSKGSVHFAQCLLGPVSGTTVSNKTLLCSIPLKMTGNANIPINAADPSFKWLNLSPTGDNLLIHLADSKAQAISYPTPADCMILIQTTGDVNGSGSVNGFDALNILLYEARLTDHINDQVKQTFQNSPTFADINRDGIINGLDALDILCYEAQLYDQMTAQARITLGV